MAKYTLRITFEIKNKEGEVSQTTFEELLELANAESAEDVLETQMSRMISEFSRDSLDWTILEKCITQQKEQKESDPVAQMVE